MKTNQLSITFFFLLLFLSSCGDSMENERSGKDFLRNEWKVLSVINEDKRFTAPIKSTFREEAYILKFVNDSCFKLATSVNYGGGKYQFTSDNYVIISDYISTLVYNELDDQRNFDDQLLSVFNGLMHYTYKGNKLIFRGENSKEVVFLKQ